MKTRTKSIEQLKKELSLKIKGINNLLELSLKSEYESNERIEYSNNIAVSLRAILFGDKKNNYQSLINRVGYDRVLLFPLYDGVASLNITPTYNLLQFSIDDRGLKTVISDDLYKEGGFWGMYLSFESWINEVVIDTKQSDVEPLSRLLVVKCVADTAGAHVDNKIEEHLFNMSKHEILPVVIINGQQRKRDFELAAKTIFCETILAIAKELVDSYNLFLGIHPIFIGLSDVIVRAQKYNCSTSKFELIKYNTVNANLKIKVNSYNSNMFYECDVYSKRTQLYQIVYNHRLFKFTIINYKEILNGEYLGKFIYNFS